MRERESLLSLFSCAGDDVLDSREAGDSAKHKQPGRQIDKTRRDGMLEREGESEREGPRDRGETERAAPGQNGKMGAMRENKYAGESIITDSRFKIKFRGEKKCVWGKVIQVRTRRVLQWGAKQ